MSLDPPCLAEEILSALLVQMLRSGAVSEADLLAIEGLSEEARHHVNALIVEAAAPSKAEWEAERRRKRFRVVPDGGKPGT